MPASTNPLETLFVDNSPVDRALLVRMLEGKVRLDRGGAFYFEPGVKTRHGATQTVVLAILARKALAVSVDGFVEGASPKELEEATGLSGGTLRPVLKRLVDRQLLLRLDGLYRVPNHLIAQLGGELVREEENRG